MPVALVLRLLVKVAASLLFWRVATGRRGAAGARPRGRTVPGPTRRDRIAAVRENASIAGRVAALGVALVVTVLCLAAGLGPAILGPRWIGIALLVAATGALGAALAEGLAVHRLLAARARRRHDHDLSDQAYP